MRLSTNDDIFPKRYCNKCRLNLTDLLFLWLFSGTQFAAQYAQASWSSPGETRLIVISTCAPRNTMAAETATAANSMVIMKMVAVLVVSKMAKVVAMLVMMMRQLLDPGTGNARSWRLQGAAMKHCGFGTLVASAVCG